MSSWSGSSSGVTATGPVGPNPGNDLPRLNCAGAPACCSTRSDRSWPQVIPATAAHARSRPRWWPPRPITATTSTSQSTLPAGSRTVADGPVMQEGNLVKIRGVSGGTKPASAACGR